jgi:hypothetical protein
MRHSPWQSGSVRGISFQLVNDMAYAASDSMSGKAYAADVMIVPPPQPLGLVIQSSSAAGKSSLTDAILNLMPEEARFTCSAMTSQSLYYLGQQNRNSSR